MVVMGFSLNGRWVGGTGEKKRTLVQKKGKHVVIWKFFGAHLAEWWAHLEFPILITV